MQLPIFLDMTGTIYVAAVAGYLPGIAVGYLTSLINGISDPVNAYYAFISVLIAVISTFFANRGFFEKWYKALVPAVVLALVGGGLGSVLTYLLYGFGMGEGISAPFAHTLYEGGSLSLFQAQLISDLVIDFADKLICVGLVYLVLKATSSRFREAVYFHGWRQVPLKQSEVEAIRHHKTRTIPLRTKIVIIVSFAIIFIATATAGISFFLYHKITVEDQTDVCMSISNLAVATVDGDMVDEFMEKGEAAEGYKQTEDRLYSIMNNMPDIQYLYVYKILEDGCHVVFDLDTPDVKGGEPGEVIPFDESFGPYLDELLRGEPIDPIITNDTFGWLLTVYNPIYDSNGNCVAYACADISMQQVTRNEVSFIARVVSLFFGFFVLILALGLWLAEYGLLLPLRAMTKAANSLSYNSDEDRKKSIERMDSLGIKTGDEIEQLYDVLEESVKETVGYIDNIEEQSRVIGKMQNGLIFVLADMVESRDQCTGEHVRKTAAYVRLILDQLRENGEYTDIITDEYCEDVVNSAPLHDVGKIAVSDNILNKPGKLTDEEFELMKRHTTAGGEILEKAIEQVAGDSGYLKEAKNLAMYHHEKWNGTGYPTGLAGEEIPLSARIMAVADVFDALLSKRSYKAPFTFEKAMSIIEEGAGTHFDAKIVAAFKQAEDKARVIAETYMGD